MRLRSLLLALAVIALVPLALWTWNQNRSDLPSEETPAPAEAKYTAFDLDIMGTVLQVPVSYTHLTLPTN